MESLEPGQIVEFALKGRPRKRGRDPPESPALRVQWTAKVTGWRKIKQLDPDQLIKEAIQDGSVGFALINFGISAPAQIHRSAGAAPVAQPPRQPTGARGSSCPTAGRLPRMATI
jgi:hypothetical protein